MPRPARGDGGFEARLAAVDEEILAAFVMAMLATGCKQAEAARGMRVTAPTIANYLKGDTRVNVARVLAFPKLAKHFRSALCSYDHGSESVAYIAKKRRGRS